MAQLSKIVNATLISQVGLYLNLISQVCCVILMRKAHGNLLFQNLLVFLLKKKLIRKNFYSKDNLLEKYRNFTWFPGVEILWKSTETVEMWKLCLSANFPHQKSGEITVFSQWNLLENQENAGTSYSEMTIGAKIW